MDDYLKRLAQKRLEVDANKQAVDALVSYIAANPGVQNQDLIRKSMELGYDPRVLIDQALGSIKVDKTGASLNQPLEEILNQVYSGDNTPGDRFVIDPSNVKSAKAKKVNADLEGAYGVATAYKDKSGVAIPDMYAVEDAKNEVDKLRRVSTGGHELRHGTDYLVRPGFEPTTGSPYRPGHHYGDVYEFSELIREARELPQDNKIINQVAKASDQFNLKPSNFKRLASVAAGTLPVVGGVLAATMSGDASAAIPGLDEAEDVGESRDEEAMLMGEIQGYKNYQNSPARMNALKRIKSGR